VNAGVCLLWVTCAVLVGDAFAADPDARNSEGESLSQPSSGAPLGAVAQSSAAAPSVMGRKATTTDPSAGSKPQMDAKSGGAATSHADANANARTVADKSVKNVLVDDTVTDAQLKQILAKGYRPVQQAHGNEVSYCRSEQLSGERFKTKVCKTARRILEDEQRGKDLINSVERIGLQMGR
jgi:hypothetical protein